MNLQYEPTAEQINALATALRPYLREDVERSVTSYGDPSILLRGIKGNYGRGWVCEFETGMSITEIEYELKTARIADAKIRKRIYKQVIGKSPKVNTSIVKDEVRAGGVYDEMHHVEVKLVHAEHGEYRAVFTKPTGDSERDGLGYHYVVIRKPGTLMIADGFAKTASRHRAIKLLRLALNEI